MRVLIIIPAYNEAENIETVVSGLSKDHSYDFVIVNDGSTDGTADVCRENKYHFIDLPLNLGLAGAFQAGIKYAVKQGYDCAIQFDADGQHLPQYLDAMVDKLNDCDIVIGSRFIEGKKSHSMRMLGSGILSTMIRMTTGKKLTDPTSGMRAYNNRALRELATGPNLGPEPDTLSYLMKKKQLKVEEVPVTMSERLAGESYLNTWSSAWYMVRMSFSVLVIQFFR